MPDPIFEGMERLAQADRSARSRKSRRDLVQLVRIALVNHYTMDEIRSATRLPEPIIRRIAEKRAV